MNNYNENFNSMNGQTNNIGVNNIYQQTNQQPVYANYEEKHNKSKLPIVLVTIIVVGVIALGILLATGLLGKKTLVCTLTQNSNGITITNKMTVDFRNNVAYKLDGLIDVDFTSVGTQYETYKDYLLGEYQKIVDDFKKDGIDATLSSNGTKVSISYFAEDDKFVSLGLNEEGKYDYVKKYFEDQKYVCE